MTRKTPPPPCAVPTCDYDGAVTLTVVCNDGLVLAPPANVTVCRYHSSAEFKCEGGHRLRVLDRKNSGLLQ